MRMVSNVKVGPHANDIKKDQRDKNGINADQDFGDDIRVNGMMMMGWIIKMHKGLKYFFHTFLHSSRQPPFYVLWQAHISKICSMADTPLQDMFYGRHTSLCSSGVAKDRAVQGRARHRLESGWSFRTRVWSLSTFVTNWLTNALETLLVLTMRNVLTTVKILMLNSGQDF